MLECAAGEPWDEVVAYAVEHGLAGIECLSGIPGSTGATPIQNVGAYGQDVSQTIAWVRAYDREADAVRTMSPAECAFEYRHSVFKYHDRWTVLAVGFRLRDVRAFRPAHLRRAVPHARRPGRWVRARSPTCGRPCWACAAARAWSSTPATRTRSAPARSSPTRSSATRRGRRSPGDPPGWPEPDGRIKTSAAWLIERSGFHKGYGDGRAGISTKHTLALVNRGDATTAELMALAREIAAGVRERFGVDLHPEPVLVGHSW